MKTPQKKSKHHDTNLHSYHINKISFLNVILLYVKYLSHFAVALFWQKNEMSSNAKFKIKIDWIKKWKISKLPKCQNVNHLLWREAKFLKIFWAQSTIWQKTAFSQLLWDYQNKCTHYQRTLSLSKYKENTSNLSKFWDFLRNFKLLKMKNVLGTNRLTNEDWVDFVTRCQN